MNSDNNTIELTKKLSTLRHDMRNHLTVILAMAQLLERRLADESQQSQARTIVERAQSLNEMISELTLP